MNVMEGMRRLGIVLGLGGSVMGVLLGYDSALNLWNAHVTHQRFESLMASPVMLSIAKEAEEVAIDPDFRKLSDEDQKAVLDVLGRLTNQGVNLGGIKEVNVNTSGRISSIELSTGESLPRTDPPTLMAFVGLLLYPIGGFLAPWGAIGALAWLVAGLRSK